MSFSPSFCSNVHADRAVHLRALEFCHWKCWALFFCLFYAVSLKLGKYSFAFVTVQPVWGTKKRRHLCCVTVIGSSLFNDTRYHTVVCRVCETVCSGIFRFGVTELRMSVGRWSVIPSLVFNPPTPHPNPSCPMTKFQPQSIKLSLSTPWRHMEEVEV